MRIIALPELDASNPLTKWVHSSKNCYSEAKDDEARELAIYLWAEVTRAANAWANSEPDMHKFLDDAILSRANLHQALAVRLGKLLSNAELPSDTIEKWTIDAFSSEAILDAKANADLIATTARDPVLHDFTQPILFRKGYLALQGQRVANWLWQNNKPISALFLQARICDVFGIDIHPAAKIGGGVFFDHANGIVIGETAVVGDGCSILQEVTLGGTGKDTGDRHPKLGNGVLIGAGAKVLGNRKIGSCSMIAAGSVVLSDVPPCKVMAGVPAKIVGDSTCADPANRMDQDI